MIWSSFIVSTFIVSDTMLFWLPPQRAPGSGTSAVGGVGASSSSCTLFDDDEKAAKLLRRAHTKHLNMLLATGLILTVLSLMTIKAHHSLKLRGAALQQHPSNRHDQQHQQQQRRNEVDVVASARLPIDSIYRLQVENEHGALTSLLEYAGMVTLVVNTACQ